MRIPSVLELKMIVCLAREVTQSLEKQLVFLLLQVSIGMEPAMFSVLLVVSQPLEERTTVTIALKGRVSTQWRDQLTAQ
jgi:hypothetical protein